MKNDLRYTLLKPLSPAGERNKCMDRVNDIVEEMLTHGIDRKACLVAVGGGVIGDLGGFAASIALRGINLIQVPTSLMAMVDSSIGGKTGVDSDQGKNLIGSFYIPAFVVINVNFLKTLDDRNFRNSLVESIKMACIRDKEMFEQL